MRVGKYDTKGIESRRALLRASASILKDVCDSVCVITIMYKMKSCSFEGAKDVEWRTYKILPEDRFYVFLDCINSTCVNGGFDITNMLIDLVNQRKTETFGRLICDGWEDEERVGSYRCLAEIEYNIAIEYVR